MVRKDGDRMNIIVESEQRVGSRWVHYMLATLYKKGVSPEMDGEHALLKDPEGTAERVRTHFRENNIVKFHHVHIEDILKYIQPVDYKIVSVVRNPRDRAVSVAFHHIHDPGKARWPQREMSYEEAVRYTVMEYDRYPISNARMISNMKNGHSSFNFLSFMPKNDGIPQIWIPYEYLVENPLREMSAVVDFIGEETKFPLPDVIEHHSFKKRTGRELGEEDRKDVWRRKGVTGDWENWFDDELRDATEWAGMEYWQKIQDNSPCPTREELDNAFKNSKNST
jgi:hypothetical protein